MHRSPIWGHPLRVVMELLGWRLGSQALPILGPVAFERLFPLREEAAVTTLDAYLGAARRDGQRHTRCGFACEE